MTHIKDQHAELWNLLEALCEDVINADQMARLEALLRQDPEARQFYLAYIELHGSLYWDAAISEMSGYETEIAETNEVELASPSRSEIGVHAIGRRRRSRTVTVLLAAMLFVGIWTWREAPLPWGAPPQGDRPLGEPELALDNPQGPSEPSVSRGAMETRPRRPLTLHREFGTWKSPVAQSESGEATSDLQSPRTPPPEDGVPLVEAINTRIASRWREEGITPSPRAADTEWVRRVYLDLVGHIPPAEQVAAFLRDERPDKRGRLVEALLDDPSYVHNWTTVFANLLVGRAESEDVNRPALERYLQTALAENRGWDQMVVDFVAAEGNNVDNGETNFLLAHLNNEAVPATAITARIFLGMQVQCTQCHDHPFSDAKQDQFWELNSFFKQTEKVRRPHRGRATGEMAGRVTELVSKPIGGPTDYETRRGLMQVAYPEFDGVRIDDGPHVNRRQALAELLVSGDETQVARAIVNRMWHHFFGYGFTLRVDDMGPHNPPSHPEILDRMTREFVRSGYDLKQLMKWICSSEPYQLTSKYNENNSIDDPAAGQPALFSRMYVKSMTAEQAYDSLLVATGVHLADKRDRQQAEQRRREWLQQFVMAFETDENDEATTFDGTIPQALMMMNGKLIDGALSAQPNTTFGRLLTENLSDADRFRQLFLAALSRYPTEKEEAAFRRMLRQQRDRNLRSGNVRQPPTELLQDVFWACLNSNEFILIH